MVLTRTVSRYRGDTLTSTLKVRRIDATTGWKPGLLEREREVAQLDAAGEAARAGSGATVLIEAAAGMGKTRLLQGLQDRGARAGMRVLSARATELEREFSYGVVRQLFGPLLAGPSEREDLLEGPAAAARPPLGLDEQRASSHGELSFAALSGLYSLAVKAGQAGSLLLAVDDAHWADSASLRFLMFLAPRLDGLSMLQAVASRPVGVESPLARLGSDPSTLRLRPAPLGADSVAGLVGDALGLPPDAAFASACFELTGGNPFFVAELARTLAAGHVQPTREKAAVVGDLVPDTIARAVLLRLAPLSDAARALARSVAILGDGCENRLAGTLSGVDPTAVLEAADSLRGAEILGSDSRLRFTYPLARNAVYSEIPPGARSREHERAAALLVEEGMPRERVAAHLLAITPAGNASVSRQLCDAARAALDKGSADPAVAYLVRALAEPPPVGERSDVLELLLTAAVRAADASAVPPYEAELMEEFGFDPLRVMRFGPELAMWLIGTGQVERAAGVLERAIDAAGQAGDLGLAVALEGQLISFTQLPPRQARERFRRYAGRLVKDSPEHRLSLGLHAWWSSFLGDTAVEAADLARRALAGGHTFAEQHDSPVPGQAILVLARADELDAAKAAAEHQLAEAIQHGGAAGLSAAWFERGYVAERRGQLGSAESCARQAVSLSQLRGCLAVAPRFSALLVDVLVQRDDLESAESELVASGMAGEIPDGYWLGPVLFSRGRLRLAQGRARNSADDLLDLRERMARWEIAGSAGSPVGAYAAGALAALGDGEQARALAEEQLATARRWGATSAVGEALAALGTVTGGDRGIALLVDATRLLESAPTPILRAATLVDLGVTLRHARRATDAREPLRAGLALARRCGATALARLAAEELEASGERAGRYMPLGVESLTASEQRVAELAAKGMKNREIAVALHVAIKTVESHLHAAFDKLGIQSRHNLSEVLGSS
jgi:DNA-binding CsgD family transcriptional regulator